MKNIKKDWQSIVEGIKAVTEKTERMVDELDRLGKVKSAMKKKTVNEARHKRVAKRGVGVTAGASVFDIIKTNGKGVDVAELEERTGLSEKEIRRAVFSLRKEGKVKRVFMPND